MKSIRIPLRIILPLVLCGFLSSCFAAEAVSPGNVAGFQEHSLSYEIGPVFRAFYEFHGGYELLGGAISAVQTEGSMEFQYTEAACIMFDPKQPESRRFRLVSLANEMGLAEPSVSEPKEGELYIGGHIVYYEFVPMYLNLGGEDFVGRPLTEVRFNPNKNRFEQYFENLGFYRMASERPGSVDLLAYGAWSCGISCQYRPGQSSHIDIYPSIAHPFTEFVSNVGTDLTGFQITEAFLAPDGKIEQIFERVVLVVDPVLPEHVFLRPLPQKLGLPIISVNDAYIVEDMQLYQINETSGIYVPEFFWSYIEDHGGFSVSGEPISVLVYQNNKLYSQCYQNFCLVYDDSAGESISVQPELLGYAYRDIYYHQAQAESRNTVTGEAYNMQVWTSYSSIATENNQEIWANIIKNNAPFPDAVLELIINLPDGTIQEYAFPPTSEDGRTFLVTPPINAPNGKLIPYQVCMTVDESARICVSDDYLIWNIP